MQYDYPPVVIKTEDRKEYFAALSRADNKELQPFIEFIGEQLEHSLSIYLKGAKGESIDEPDDIDKEIALLKISIGKKELQSKSEKRVKEIILNLIPFFEKFESKCRLLNDLFSKNESFLRLESNDRRRTFNTINDLKKIDLVDSDIRKVNLSFSYTWSDLKSIVDEFDFYIKTSVFFNKYNYIIQSNSSKELKKFYNESITKQEQDQIIKENIKSIINEIKNHSK